MGNFGKFAILVDGKIKSFHHTNKEAILKASEIYNGKPYSVMRVDQSPVDLGFVDFADDHRKNTR